MDNQDDSDDDYTPAERLHFQGVVKEARERLREKREAAELLPPPPPNEFLWMSEMCKAFAPDGYKDEPHIVKAGNSFAVKFQNGQTEYNKTFPTLALSVAHRDEKAREFGIEENVARIRIQNRLRNGKGDEDVRFTSVLEFLKAKFPETYSSMDENQICWDDTKRQWSVQTRVDGKKVYHGNLYMWQFAEAIAKRDEVRGYTNKDRDERNAAIIAADPMYKDVPYAATNDGLKPWHKKHWTTNYMDKDRPWLVVKGTKWFHPACQHAGCDRQASGDGRGGKPTVCTPHGGGRRCLGAPGVDGGCPNDCHVVDKYKYDGMCVRCFCVAEPDDIRATGAKKYFQAKEQTVRAFLKRAFPEYKWTFNSVWSRRGAFEGHPKYRPDGRTMIADRVIIVEIDEHSHASYKCGKERTREADFVATAASEGKIIVLLRLNPDGYTDEHGVYFPTCFKLSKKSGQVTVDPKQQTQWDGRLAKLGERVRFFLDPSNPVPPPQCERACYTQEFSYHDVAGNAAKKRSREEF